MISKIQENDYLKRVGNMTVEERADYLAKVEAWINTNGERLLNISEQCLLQNVQQASMAWNDVDCAAWDEGVVLLSALAFHCETWLPDALYTKSANRCVKHVVSLLTEFSETAGQDSVDDGKTSEHIKGVPTPVTGKDAKTAGADTVTGAGVPVRPKHIDQYVHLLPNKTQERASQVRDLLREIDVAREKLRLLTDTPNSSASDRESWAKKVTSLDDKVRSIYKELDDEWEKLVKSGTIVVDDLGNVRINPTQQDTETPVAPTDETQGTSTGETPDAGSETEKENEAAKLRKWLIDTRKTGCERHTEKWIAKYQGMVKLGGKESVTDKVRDAAKHYGIDLDKVATK